MSNTARNATVFRVPLTEQQFTALHSWLGSPLRRLRRLRDAMQRRQLTSDHWEFYEQVVKAHDELYKLVLKAHSESIRARQDAERGDMADVPEAIRPKREDDQSSAHENAAG